MIAAVSTDLLLGLIALAAIVVAVRVSISAREQHDRATREHEGGGRNAGEPALPPPPPPGAGDAATEIDPGDLLSNLHRRAQALHDDVGWPEGKALAQMPAFREGVDEILARGLDTLAITEVAEDADDIVSSFALAALIQRGELPETWTATAVHRLRKSSVVDEHFLLLALVHAPGRVIGPVLRWHGEITDEGMARFLDQRVAAGEPVDAETFATDIGEDDIETLADLFESEPDVPPIVRAAFADWRESGGGDGLRRYLGGVGTVWQPPYDSPPASLLAGRDEIVARLAETLSATARRSVVLVGEHGVG